MVVVTCSVIHVMSFLDEENMSSLIFYTDEAQALIVTDTLAVTDNGEPLSLFPKQVTSPAKNHHSRNGGRWIF